MTRLRSILLCLLLLVCATSPAADEVFKTDDGAIRGYDPVAYFSDGKAVKGKPEFSHEWNGASWRFSSQANLDRFAKTPEQFAPQYGGYCAYGTSRGYKVGTDPEAFAVHEGKLYLNYNKAVQTTWNQDRPGYIKTADGNWLKLEHEAYAP